MCSVFVKKKVIVRSLELFGSGILTAIIGIYTSTKSWRGNIFIAVCLCVYVCLCVCLSVCVSVTQNSSRKGASIWMRLTLNGCLHALARTLLKLITLGQRTRSQLRNINFFIILCITLPTLYLSTIIFNQNEIRYVV